MTGDFHIETFTTCNIIKIDFSLGPNQIEPGNSKHNNYIYMEWTEFPSKMITIHNSELNVVRYWFFCPFNKKYCTVKPIHSHHIAWSGNYVFNNVKMIYHVLNL